MVVRGPGIKRGSRCDEPVTGCDFLPTFVDLAGGSKTILPEDHDGCSLRPLFQNGERGRISRSVEGLVFHFPDFQGVSMSAIRLGDYKLLKDWETGRIHLYNLVDDLGETQDLVAKMPQKADELYRKLMDYLNSVNAEKAEDIHLDSLKQAIEQKRKLEIQIRELLDSEDSEGKDEWSRLNMRLNFQHNRIEQLRERLHLINEANRKEAGQ
jgi:arylsulfatase A-like enzyme